MLQTKKSELLPLSFVLKKVEELLHEERHKKTVSSLYTYLGVLTIE